MAKVSLLNEVKEMVRIYEERFSDLGITVKVSDRTAHSEVGERTGTPISSTALLTAIERAMDHRRERKKGYGYEPNRYTSIVLSFLPNDKALLPKEDCKDYAFLLKKTERAHVGETPETTRYGRDKVLRKIEKRLLKTLEKAQRSSVRSACRNTLWDVYRYAFSRKYRYKEKIRGKDPETWELIFSIPIGIAVAAVFALILVAIEKLF